MYPRIYVQKMDLRHILCNRNQFTLAFGVEKIFLEGEFSQICQIIAIKVPAYTNIMKYYFELRHIYLNGIFLLQIIVRLAAEIIEILLILNLLNMDMKYNL